MVLKESDSELARGDTAPAFELRGTDGEYYSPTDFTDNDAFLLVFTCNHCPYAQAKFDHLNELSDAFDDAAVVGINPNANKEYPDDSYENMVELVADGTVDYDAYLYDETQNVAREYGAVCTPDPFLFAGDGSDFELVYHGRIDDAPNPDDEPTVMELRDIVDRLLSGEEIDDEFRPSRGCSIKWKDD